MSHANYERMLCQHGFDHPADCESPICIERGCQAPVFTFSPEEKKAAMREWNAYCAKLKRELDRR